MENPEATVGPLRVELESAGRFARAPVRPWLAFGLSLYALALPFLLLTIDPPAGREEGTPFTLKASIEAAKEKGAPTGLASVAMRGLVGLLIAGASITAVLAFSCLALPATRRRLNVRRVADRPPPAIRFIDLLAAFLVMKILSSVVALAYLQMRGSMDMSIGERVLVSLGIQVPFYALTILLVVKMARVRGGRMGAVGIWPFWETPGLAKPRALGTDVFLGVGGFILCFWLLVTFSFLNKWSLSHVGVVQDENPILTVLTRELGGAQRFWVYGVVFFSVVVMAPIAEEVLFRGLLYNFLRRHLDRWTAACAGALLFSFLHGVLADQWALFALGLMLTWVYERTGRLLPAVILHAVNNGIAVGYMLVVQS